MRRPKYWAMVGVALLLLGTLLAACTSISLDDMTPAVGLTRVAVVDNSFEPRVIEIPRGTSVTWHWGRARRDHNVVGQGFLSPVQRDGEFTHVFDAEGTYDYLCALHSGQTGRVIVTEG